MELTRPSSRCPLFSSDGAVQGDTVPSILGECMTIEVPAYDSDEFPDGSKLKDLAHKSNAMFQWPPDCLWPFIDHGPETDT